MPHPRKTLFHWDYGLKLTRADLAVDVRRRQPRAFISHAHSDHIARHEYALATPATAALYQLRLGPRPTLDLPYRMPIEWGGLRLTTYPAGHCLGSAMLLAEDQGQSLLYTGDFKLGPSATAERAELPHAETLVIESTYGHPDYRLPPREEVLGEFFALVRRTLEAGAVPVILGYVLGKSQELTRLLCSQGIGVLQHRKIYEVSRVYEAFGVHLGDYGCFTGRAGPGQAVVVPPGTPLGAIRNAVRFALTGWAIEAGAKYRLGVDYALPLSDHADYPELLEAVERVGPQTIFCTHGPASFVDRLRDLGHDAHVLGRPTQQRLF
ncbi:MAG: MBL fold metallo-hydrolase RNA specificity domain-containing protein [Thermoguttaceae bacterium]